MNSSYLSYQSKCLDSACQTRLTSCKIITFTKEFLRGIFLRSLIRAAAYNKEFSSPQGCSLQLVHQLVCYRQQYLSYLVSILLSFSQRITRSKYMSKLHLQPVNSQQLSHLHNEIARKLFILLRISGRSVIKTAANKQFWKKKKKPGINEGAIFTKQHQHYFLSPEQQAWVIKGKALGTLQLHPVP